MQISKCISFLLYLHYQLFSGTESENPHTTVSILLSFRAQQHYCISLQMPGVLESVLHLHSTDLFPRKWYVVKHNLIIEVYLMTMRWKQLHVSACTGHHQVV